MAPKFGTSGLRGLVIELSADLVTAHVRAFLLACPYGTGLWVGRDLRDSSPDLSHVVIEAARASGVDVTDCGDVPTPALAMAAMAAGAAAIMVTGSHIPADRNGLKFYVPTGEITKADEAAILAHVSKPQSANGRGSLSYCETAGEAWVTRVVRAFGTSSLKDMRIGVWSHSSVARDYLQQALSRASAVVVELDRSSDFIPVDTEAVAPETRAVLAKWVRDNRLDAVVSTDGDGDRPLLVDDQGCIVPGDVMGQITAGVVGANTVVAPVSANSGVDRSGRFITVHRTRIGSPFVIAGMQEAGGHVVGYEPNGGFLLGFDALGPVGPLAPLWTRDSLLPLFATLVEGRRTGSLTQRVAQEPPCYTAADRLEHIPTERSQALMASFTQAPHQLTAFLLELGEHATGQDRTDGLRLTLASGRVLHMRPSGNAPEFRLYTEAESRSQAEALLTKGLRHLAAALSA